MFFIFLTLQKKNISGTYLMMENYELITTAVVSGIIPVKKFRSKETGFTVCISFVDGPIVNGYFCLGMHLY